MAKKEPVPIKFPPTPELAVKFEAALAIAGRYPDVEESRSYGTPAIKVKGKLMARLRSEAEGSLAIVCPFDDREALMELNPDVFFITDHYQDYEFLLVDLMKADLASLESLIDTAWNKVAPAASRKKLA